MNYRKFGNTGEKISALGFGSPINPVAPPTKRIGLWPCKNNLLAVTKEE